MAPKVFVLGIDGMPPEKILEWQTDLPTFSKLMKEGWYSRIRSTIPPTSIAAWSSFFSGFDPGELDIFGYTRKPTPPDYETKLVNSTHVKVKRIWEILGDYGRKSIVIGAPLTYPAKQINGIMITDFMTPGFDSQCMYPENLKEEVRELLGGPFIFDVSEFAAYRKLKYEDLIEKIWKITEDQFTTAYHLLSSREWDFFAFINYGSDRLHHTLWRFTDPTHKRYEEHAVFSNTIKNFYKFLDGKIARLLTMLGGNTTFIVSSDHGMQKMNGRFNINDWLLNKGYLVLYDDFLAETKERLKKLDFARIDWGKTRAYALGAYECFIFINKKGRDPQGVVDEKDYEPLVKELTEELRKIRTDDNQEMNTAIFTPDEIYIHGYGNEAPDLIVYFDNLYWGINADLGNKGLYSWANLVGPDDGLHSQEGLFIMYGSAETRKGLQPAINITDVASKMLNILGIT